MSRSLVISLVACLWLWLADSPRAEDTPPIIRHVFVPKDKSVLWPEGDRVEVLFSEYEELRAATRAVAPQRRATHIEWQMLSATFDSVRGAFVDGRWSAEVRGGETLPQLLSLEPLDLAISELKWADSDAVWGTAPTGDIFLQVTAPAKRLEGKFSRQAKRLQRTWQLPLRLANATVTELKLRVPAKLTLKSSVGQLRGPLATGEEGWRLWQLSLGSQSRCELQVIDTPVAAPTEPLVVYEQTSSYVLREAEVELQCEIQAEVFHTPKAALSFTVPDDLSVYSVGFSGDSRLAWRELPRVVGQARHIEVQLPEPQIGRLRTLQLLAGTVAKWEPSWMLPRIVLDGGWFTSGRWNVSVDAPLVWRAVRPTGLRLSEVDANTLNVRRLSFAQYLADASLGMDVSYPEPRVSTRGLQRLTVLDNEWLLTSEWHWQSTSGKTFAARWRVPTGWEISDVLSLTGSSVSDVRHWDVILEPSGQRLLTCDFTTALEDRAIERLRIVARRSRSLTEDRDSFELPTPLNCQLVDQLLAVTLPTGWRWDQAEDAAPAQAAIKRLGEPWTTFELWKSDVVNWGETTLLSRSTQAGESVATKLSLVVGQPARTIPNPSAEATDLPPVVHNGHGGLSAPLEPETEQLVWTTAELRSLIFPGADGEDRHSLTLRAAHSTRVGRLEFELPEPAKLVSVRMNDVRAEPEREGHRFRLPSIPQGGLQTLEIHYSSPSDREFLHNQQTVPLPRIEAPVLGFRWLFALPPEARLSEEPEGMRLLQPLDPTPWSRRFFGPLGRDESSVWFNPGSSRAWYELWLSSPRVEKNHELVDSSFAPLGWKVREAVSPTLPSQVKWLTWNGGQVRVLAWIGMLLSVSFGCLLRCRQAASRVHIAASWLGLCVVGVVLSSPVTAEVLGGCLIGTLIAVLIPRRLLMSYSTRRNASARGAFDATIAARGVLTGTLISIAVTWSALAQQGDLAAPPSRAVDSGSKVKRFDVLIPVDDPIDAIGEEVTPSAKTPLAYVPKELLKLLREQRARQVSPATLLASAGYTVEINDQQVTLKAEYLVHRLRPSEMTTLSLPFATVPLGGVNSCLVDGQPSVVNVNPRRDALLLEFPPREQASSEDRREKVVSHKVTLNLLPPVLVEDNASRVTLSIPPVIQSSLVVTPRPTGPVEVSRRRGEATLETTSASWSANLGQIKQLSLEFAREGVFRPRITSEAKVDVACLAELTPTTLRQRYRAKYVVSSGELHDVAWTLPRGVLIREGDVQVEDLSHWALESLPDGRQKLIVEFAQPKTSEFTLDVTGLQAPLGMSDHPQWEPWNLNFTDPAVEKPASGASLLKPGTFILGVTAQTGFKVTAEPAPHATTLPDGSFLKAWGNALLPRQPQTTLQLTPSSPLSFQVTSIAAQRKVRQELLLKLGRKVFEWELHAEVTTNEASVFQHDILLAPHFRVDEVSVTEDEAERLLSWSNKDTALTAFLRSETRGIQNVFLQGRDAVPVDGRLEIPVRWFADAEIGEFSVRVTHDPSWQVQVLDEQERTMPPVETGGPVTGRPELFLGKFRAEPNRPLIHVRLTPHAPASEAEAWTVIAPIANDTLTGRHTERLVDEGLITARVHWPAEWIAGGSLRLSPSLKELARRQLPDGIELTVQSVTGVETPRELVFESQFAVGAVTAVKIKSPVSLDLFERRHEWLIAEELQTWLPETIIRPSLRNLNELPEAVQRLMPTNGKIWWNLNLDAGELELTKPNPSTTIPSPKMLWMDTTVWVADGAITEGRTWLLLQPNGLREFLLRRPEDVQWRALFVEDKLRDFRTAETQTDATSTESNDRNSSAALLRIADFPHEPLVWITLFWHVDTRQSGRIVARRDTQLPMPDDKTLQPASHNLTLVSAGHSEPSLTRGARRVQDWDGQLSRAALILRAMQSSPGPIDDATRHLWDLAQADVVRARQAIDEMPTELGAATNARERLLAVTADLEIQRSRAEQDATLAKETTPKRFSRNPPWASDAWLQVPNSWSATAEVDPTAQLSVIVLDRRWLKWTVAVLALMAVIPFLRMWLRWQTGEWLATHPYLAWASLGLIWWTCLAPSVIGFGLLVVAAITVLRHRWQRLPGTLNL